MCNLCHLSFHSRRALFENSDVSANRNSFFQFFCVYVLFSGGFCFALAYLDAKQNNDKWIWNEQRMIERAMVGDCEQSKLTFEYEYCSFHWIHDNNQRWECEAHREQNCDCIANEKFMKNRTRVKWKCRYMYIVHIHVSHFIKENENGGWRWDGMGSMFVWE